jgi:hypothetical protein
MQDLKNKTREAVIQIAKWQIGIMESPAGSNNVKFNTWYYGREVSGSAYPWCMVFVVWCFHQAGFNLRKTASCTNMANAYKKSGQWVTSGYKPGDIAMYDFDGNMDGETEHCGIITEVGNGYIMAVEGNTSASNNSNGGIVMERKRSLNVVTGACRPMYNM